MSKTAFWVQVVRWSASLLLIAAGLWSLNLAAFNAWVAGGPPTPYPEVYARRSDVFFIVSLSFFVLALMVAWLLRPKR